MSEIFTIILLLIPIYSSAFRAPNVGTTLFQELDLNKKCWDQDSMTLLHSRMFFELLLPSPRILRDLDNDLAEHLIKYFTLVLTTLQSFPEGRKKQLSIIAMQDIIGTIEIQGGYFHALLLPNARFSYYSGIINWKSMRKLNRFYNQIKEVLRTEGQGWAPPKPQNWEKYEARNLPMRPKPECMHNEAPCENIRLYRRMKCYENTKTCGRIIKVAVPVPFFDCKMKPKAIAVPFKNCPLFDVNSGRSAYVLIRYFVQSYKCLSCKCKHPCCFNVFRNNFYAWLIDEVVPRFNDAKTYVAFGGVVRLIRTLETQGVQRVDLMLERQCYNRLAGVSEEPFVEFTKQKLKIVLMSLLMVLVIWFILAACVICLKIMRKRCSCGRPINPKKCNISEKLSCSGSGSVFHKLGSRLAKKKSSGRGDSKTYYSLTDDTTGGGKSSSTKSEESSPKSSPSSPKSSPSSPKSSSTSKTYFSSDSQSRTDVQAFNVSEELHVTNKSSSSNETRGLPPIVEMSESSSITTNRRTKVRFGPSTSKAFGDSASDSGNSSKKLSEKSSASGKSGSLQEDSQVQCYSDDSEVTTEEGRTDISSDSIEQFHPH